MMRTSKIAFGLFLLLAFGAFSQASANEYVRYRVNCLLRGSEQTYYDGRVLPNGLALTTKFATLYKDGGEDPNQILGVKTTLTTLDGHELGLGLDVPYVQMGDIFFHAMATQNGPIWVDVRPVEFGRGPRGEWMAGKRARMVAAVAPGLPSKGKRVTLGLEATDTDTVKKILEAMGAVNVPNLAESQGAIQAETPFPVVMVDDATPDSNSFVSMEEPSAEEVAAVSQEMPSEEEPAETLQDEDIFEEIAAEEIPDVEVAPEPTSDEELEEISIESAEESPELPEVTPEPMDEEPLLEPISAPKRIQLSEIPVEAYMGDSPVVTEKNLVQIHFGEEKDGLSYHVKASCKASYEFPY